MRKTMLGSAFQVQTTEKNLHTKKNKRRRSSSSRSSTPDDDNPSSSASDVPDHHLLFNLHYSLAGHGEQSRIRVGKPQLTGRKDESLVGDDLTLDPVKQSFSLALKECQSRRSRSEATGGRRPASLDLSEQAGPTTGDAAATDSSVSPSPRLVVAGVLAMKRSSVPSRRSSGTFPSPGTPNYGSNTAGLHKGWSSERVPLPSNNGRRYGHNGGGGGGSSVLGVLPFNSGRTLPSKWEDAEKWIFSPVSGDNVGRAAALLPPQQRRPKSKSGPLGGAGLGGQGGIGFYSACSPLVPGFEGRSPFSAGVLIPDRACVGNGRGRVVGGGDRVEGRSSSAETEPCMVHCASVNGWSSLPSSRDERVECTKDASTMISPPILRKDVSTQMSPEGSSQSSPKDRPHISSPSPSTDLQIADLQSHLSKLEVRDVQVDDRVTVTRWTKKQINIDWKRKTSEVRASAWEVAETAKCISKLKREEAKITAWENLQKAKAEAAIGKLEMKLEKKRSSSMDKILNKLRSAQRKAQAMRSIVSSSQANQVVRTSTFRRTGQMSSLSGCFTCHAF